MAAIMWAARLWKGRRGMETLQGVLILAVGAGVVAALKLSYTTTMEPATTATIDEIFAGADGGTGGGKSGGKDGRGDTGKNPAGQEVDRDRLAAQLKDHEGYETKVYTDTELHPTIGVGFNLDRADAKEKIEALGKDYEKIRNGQDTLSEDQVRQLLNADMEAAIANCQAVFPTFSDLSDARQRALADMMFNLGRSKFEGFKNMIDAVKAGDFDKAADEIKDSTWYDQVKRRGPALEEMMRTGDDPARGPAAAR